MHLTSILEKKQQAREKGARKTRHLFNVRILTTLPSSHTFLLRLSRLVAGQFLLQLALLDLVAHGVILILLILFALINPRA